MTGRPQRTPRNKGKGRSASTRNAVPDIYQEMLSETRANKSEISERPLKKRKTGKQPASSSHVSSSKPLVLPPADDSDEDEIHFEDVFGVENEISATGTQQTAYRDSDDESDASDQNWEPFDFDAKPDEEPIGDLVLTLSKKEEPQKASIPRRKAATRDEKGVRLQVHKMHILCLLYYVERRNRWCNDYDVQKSLKPLLTKKIVKFLKPEASYSQFARTNSLKRGLEQVMELWNSKFKITERGMKRPLWADDEKALQNVSHACYFLHSPRY